MQMKTLNTGASMPAIGYGTWQLRDGTEATEAIVAALQAGYRLIDTAKLYGNERSVGEAIRASDIPREEIFVTTKLWSGDLGYESAHRAFKESLERLGLEYVDLYLIHWPGIDARADAWRALEEIYRDGRAKAIGVSNYEIRHLEEVRAQSDIVPAVNQIELHAFNYHEQREVLAYCHEQGVVVQAYSPLAQATDMKNPAIQEIAAAYGKTPAQVMLRWCVQHGTVPIPKSSNPERMKENIDIFTFELTGEEMQGINDLSQAP